MTSTRTLAKPSFEPDSPHPEPRRMERLSSLVDGIKSTIPISRPVLFLDYPVHLNVGDSLIEAGTEQFFRKFGYRVTDVRSAYDFGDLSAQRVGRNTTIVMQGGGNFGDLYNLHQNFRERIVREFPNNRIVMLPQTIHFDSEENLKNCAAVYSNHRDLHVYLRDTRSLDLFRTHFDNSAYLAPDMAHALWDVFAGIRARGQGDRTLVFARKDKEDGTLSIAANRGDAMDWEDVVNYVDKAAFYAIERLHTRRGADGGSFSIHPAWAIVRNRLIARSVRMLDDYRSIITNRLHMSLLGLLLGRQVTMADNSYGKLSGYYRTWLKDVPDLTFLD